MFLCEAGVPQVPVFGTWVLGCSDPIFGFTTQANKKAGILASGLANHKLVAGIDLNRRSSGYKL